MNVLETSDYRCPVDGSRLSLVDATLDAGEAVSGRLVSAAGRSYPIEDGVPNFLVEDLLAAVERAVRADYDRVAEDIYDRAVDWQFAAFFEDEDAVREGMVDQLRLRPGMRALEIGCGTGRDSFRLAKRIGSGALHLQDLSPGMTRVCRKRMGARAAAGEFGCALSYSVSSATALPFPDAAFDAVFHFGGFNHFGDLKRGAAELTRVAKTGARIVYGDEAVAPWLKGTEFDGVVCANNPLFKADTPLWTLPECAREASVSWVIANCFYVIAFTKGEGPPPLDLDLPHTGVRGGSMRSRYYGVLEGVRPETKEKARAAAAAAGVSMHDWLESALAAAFDGKARR
jgi:ubiquinone/menaquinone biosynthesis C-methylase UbiE